VRGSNREPGFPAVSGPSSEEDGLTFPLGGLPVRTKRVLSLMLPPSSSLPPPRLVPLLAKLEGWGKRHTYDERAIALAFPASSAHEKAGGIVYFSCLA